MSVFNNYIIIRVNSDDLTDIRRMITKQEQKNIKRRKNIISNHWQKPELHILESSTEQSSEILLKVRIEDYTTISRMIENSEKRKMYSRERRKKYGAISNETLQKSCPKIDVVEVSH